jgi:glycine cleavage system H protein
MVTPDPYVTKALEYLLGIGFLVLFVFFWRYATGGTGIAVPATVRARVRAPLADMFRVPDGVMFHPGHAWAMAQASDTVTVGMDDFAQQLVGRIKAVALPSVGTTLEQGMHAWRLQADGKSVDMLSPVSGKVVAVNEAVLEDPAAVNRDPFGRGWLIKVQSPRWVTNSKQLLAGPAARRWTDTSWEQLSSMFAPELGTIMHDGGAPVTGLARGVDEENWDAVARQFLLS